MKKYEHLFFDLDHTIWDFESNSRNVIEILYDQFDLIQYNIPNKNVFFQVFSAENDRLWDRYRQGFIKQQELRWKRFWNTLLHFKVANESLSKELSETYVQLLPNQTLLMPGAKEILNYCKNKNYKLHIITNGFEEVQIRKMTHSNIIHYFDAIITSEKSMSMKPKKEIFDYALEYTNASQEQSIMIGDNWEADINGAILAGWDNIYYNPSQLPIYERCTYNIQHWNDLTTIL